MPQPQLIIHAGAHKTATTYLQKKFSESRDLLADHNWLYPEENPGIGYGYGHHQLAQELLQGNCVPDWENYVSPENILLSSENFSKLSASQFSSLLSAFPNHEPTFVFWIRHYATFWPAQWQNQAIHGSRLSYVDFLRVRERFAFDHAIESMRSTKNRRLRIFKYEDFSTGQPDIFHFFSSELLQVPVPTGIKPDKRVNSRFSPEVLDLLRLCLHITGAHWSKFRPAIFPLIHGEHPHPALLAVKKMRPRVLRSAHYSDFNVDVGEESYDLERRYSEYIEPTANQGEDLEGIEQFEYTLIEDYLSDQSIEPLIADLYDEIKRRE